MPITYANVRIKQPSWWRIKTDGIDADSHCAEFYQLGLGKIEQIAASQGRGVTQLMEQVLAPLAEKLQENEAENDRTSDEEEKDEWDHEFDFDSEEDTSLIDDALGRRT